MNELEQYSRENNVIINGIPFHNDENVHELVMGVANTLNVTLHESDINIAHRLQTNRRRILL